MRVWVSLLAVAGLITASPVWADTGYLKIIGSKSGPISGEVTAGGKEKQHEVVDLKYSVEIPTGATGQATGRRSQQPVIFTLRWSRGTPQLFNAALTNETLSQIIFSRWVSKPSPGNPAGVLNSDDIIITNGRISAIRIVDRNGDQESLDPLVEVTVAYQRLELIRKEGNITSTDDWTPN